MTEKIPYHKTETGRVATRTARQKYSSTEKGKAAIKRSNENYRKSENGRLHIRLANKKYRTTSEHGKLCRYNNRKHYYSRTQHLTEGKRKWTLEEEYILLNFTGSDEELAYEINRSVAAIQAHRYVIKKGGGCIHD